MQEHTASTDTPASPTRTSVRSVLRGNARLWMTEAEIARFSGWPIRLVALEVSRLIRDGHLLRKDEYPFRIALRERVEAANTT